MAYATARPVQCLEASETGTRTNERTTVRIVIAGGGTAGWMTATTFARFLEAGFEIDLIESDEIGTVGVGEATIPQIRLFNDALGLDEDAFLRATQGTYKRGIEFVDWLKPGHRYMHAFGDIGRDVGLLPFHQYWLRAKALGLAGDLAAYSRNNQAALACRLHRPALRRIATGGGRMSIAAALLIALSGPATVPIEQVRARAPEDEIIYFVLPDRFDNGDPANDRGGLTGDRLTTGYDPTSKAFYHGGDQKGLTQRLNYIQALGATAIWLAPIFKNKPVQGAPGQESAGYHGYWVTDFTHVDPHFGTDAEFATFVEAAHARGMKVYMDIIANHTADVIEYRECVDKPCPYRGKADYPYQRRGGVAGKAINPGFAGDAVQTPENFARLTDRAWAYTPFVPLAEAQAKVPDWLNDPHFHHNRGNSTFAGESARYGDFAGLDDVMTEDPRVVSGFIAIFGSWIDCFGIDGFRIDTARHVNPEFWQAVVPAMQARAAARGIPNFHVFGEVYSEVVDPGYTAQYTRRDKLPAVLDFSFQAAARAMLSGKAGTDVFARLIDGDVLYEGGDAAAQRLPTFLGNHDMGRMGHMLDLAWPDATEAERVQRLTLAHVLLLSARGVPTIYSGDEQGFTGHGNDQDAREDVFASQVASYNDNRLIGTATTTATAHFGHLQARHRLWRLVGSHGV